MEQQNLDDETINIRGLTSATLHQFRTGARARGMTQANYLGALLDLHSAMRTASQNDADTQELLASLGLATVSA